MIFVIGTKSANLRRIRAAMIGMFTAVANKDSVLFEVSRCGSVEEC